MDCNEAREYAIKAHGDQKYGEQPYVVHLDAVASILKGVEPLINTQIIAYLHDVVEDTSVTLDEINRYWGPLTAEAIYCLTDEQGENRNERKRRTNVKLAGLNVEETVCRLALIVKAADRLANVRAGGKNDMYRREHAEFKKAVYRPGLCDKIWDEIDAILGEKK